MIQRLHCADYGYGGLLTLDMGDSESANQLMDLLQNGHFNHFEPGIFDSIIQSIKEPADQWMTAADFRSFVDTQDFAGRTYLDATQWTRMSILNSAHSGRFSTDRTMRDYNDEIWRLEPITHETS